jgi:hypothetical protein
MNIVKFEGYDQRKFCAVFRTGELPACDVRINNGRGEIDAA